jgi:hypothetical protein
MKDFNAVDATGNGTYSTNLPLSNPLVFEGILLNNPADMLNGTANSASFLGGQWQVFVQSTRPGDFGGIAVYMAQNYGNLPPNYVDGAPDPSRNYSNSAWDFEVARVSVLAGRPLQAGDKISITARAFSFFSGKTNVNETHRVTANYDFDISLITANAGLPTATPLRLADIWDSNTNAVAFDNVLPYRETGGERYQGELVRLLDVKLAAPVAAWSKNTLYQVIDRDGRSFSLHTGLNDAFTSALPPTDYFSVTGIFNQETPPLGPYTGNYELWVMDPSTITAIPEPGLLALLGVTGLLLFCSSRRIRFGS